MQAAFGSVSFEMCPCKVDKVQLEWQNDWTFSNIFRRRNLTLAIEHFWMPANSTGQFSTWMNKTGQGWKTTQHFTLNICPMHVQYKCPVILPWLDSHKGFTFAENPLFAARQNLTVPLLFDLFGGAGLFVLWIQFSRPNTFPYKDFFWRFPRSEPLTFDTFSLFVFYSSSCQLHLPR